jgi:hypothetical protein
MSISRTKFVILFIICGFVFFFITSTLLGTTGPRGFPEAPDSVLRTGSDSPVAWKRTVSTILVPIKAVLLGPLALPQVTFLKEDPPPPFIGIYLLFYWTILALVIYYLIDKIKRS